MDFAVLANHILKLKERENWDKYLDLAKEQKKAAEPESNITSSNWCARYSQQMIDKWTGGLRNKRTSGDHPNYNIVDIGQNAKKSPGDVRRLAITQTPVENYQLMLVWKTFKMTKMIH